VNNPRTVLTKLLEKPLFLDLSGRHSMVQAVSDLSMASNHEIIEHPNRTTSEIDFQSDSLPLLETSEDICMDELWDLADATVAETLAHSALPPLMLPLPLIPISPLLASSREVSGKDHYEENATATATVDSEDHVNPVSLLRTAGDMAAAGRISEARLCRKRAMLLMQVVT